MFIYSAAVTFMSEWASRSSASQSIFFIQNHFLQFWDEMIFVFLVTMIFYAILRRADLPLLIIGLLFSIASTANYIKVSTRSEPLLPWDLTVIKDAAEIASRVKIHITHEVIISYLFVLACAAGAFLLRRRIKLFRLHIAVRAGIMVLVAAVCVVFTESVFMSDYFIQKHDIKEITWSQVDNYTRNGFIFSFLNNLSHRSVVKPPDYSKQTVQAAENSISVPKTSTAKPNIIMVQDEAFCDLTEFKNVTFSQDIMPEIDYLKANYMSGYTLTPMYGGGTCNSEFEVLTGFSYSDLPNGSVPYEEYFKTPTFSYASFLKSIGYSTIAVHSFDKTFWDRNTVFPNIGFDKFIAEDKFTDPQKERGFISDLATMKMITKQYQDNLKTGKPFFNFTITMQNHFSWGADDYPADYRVGLTAPGLTQDEKDILTTYATGVRDADAALKYLVDYYSKVKQPTIIVFYGDHMPALDENTLEAGGYINGDPNSPENIQKRHSTPYVIWNNYGAGKTVSSDISMYELAPYLTQSFDLQRPLYFDFLQQMAGIYKGYATGVYIGSNNQPTMQMPQGGQEYHDMQYLFEYDLLIGDRYGQALTK